MLVTAFINLNLSLFTVRFNCNAVAQKMFKTNYSKVLVVLFIFNQLCVCSPVVCTDGEDNRGAAVGVELLQN